MSHVDRKKILLLRTNFGKEVWDHLKLVIGDESLANDPKLRHKKH